MALYIGMSLFWGVIFNLYYYSLLKSFEVTSIPWFIIAVIASTLALDFVMQLSIKGEIRVLNLVYLMSMLDPPAPNSKGKQKHLSRTLELILVVQLYFIYGKVELENLYNVEFILPVFYSIVLIYYLLFKINIIGAKLIAFLDGQRF